MRFPLLPSAVQTALTPASDIRAPSVNAVVAALAQKATSSVFTSVAAGLVPASGGGTAAFLRADGTFAVPPGGGGGGGSGDAFLLDRTNHTGVQPFSTLSDGTEAVQDVVGAMVLAAGGSYNDAANTITLPGLATVQDEGITQSGVVTTYNFTGAGVTASGGGSIATINIPGAGSATISVEEGDALVSASISTLDFGAGFDVTESPAGEANVVLDLSEYTGAALPLVAGGTGSITAAGARTALGLAAVAASASASDLTAGNLAVARLNGGTGADGTTYWRGDGTWAVPPGGGGGGSTNLTFSRDATTLTVLSDTGTDAILPAATTSLAGMMSAAQATTLAAAAPLVPTVVNDATTTRTLSAVDNGVVLRFTNTSPITVTVPTAFSGMSCAIEWQDAAGTISLATSGTTINGAGTTIALSQARGMVALTPTGSANAFDLQGSIGDLTAADITDSTTVGRGVVTAVDAAAARTAIGAVIGTNVQAYNAVLTTLAGASANGQSLVTAANYGAMRTALTLVPGTDVQAYNARLADLAGISYAQGDILYHNGTNLVKLAAGTNGYFLKTLGSGANPAWANIPGGGDALVANPLSQFAATTSAQLLGVMSDETGTGVLVFNNAPALTAPVITGGTHVAVTSFGLRNTGTGAFDMTHAHNGTLTAGRTLTWNLNDAARSISLGGNITTAGALTQAGAFATTITATATSNATLPAGTTTLASNAQKAGGGIMVETPSNKSYTIFLEAPDAFTITKVVAKTASGTCTVQATINGTNVTTGSVSATSTKTSVTPTALNVVAAGDKVAITVSSNSSAADLEVSINGTRVLS